MVTGQIKTTEELLAVGEQQTGIKTTEELLGKTAKKPMQKPPWYDNYLGLIRPLLGGVQHGTAEGMKSLIKAADFISDKLGIPKSDAARMIARDLETFSQANRGRGVGGLAGDVAFGIGQAAPDIASIALMGPAGLPVHGAVLGGIEGGLSGAVSGAASGALTHGALKGMGGLAVPSRVGAGAAFGAATAPGGVEERVRGAATMGALSAMGGRPRPGIVDLRGKQLKGEPSGPRINLLKPKLHEAKARQEQDVISSILSKVKKSKPILKEQQELRSTELKKRLGESIKAGKETGGYEGFLAEKAPLKGVMPTMTYEPLDIPKAQKDIAFDILKHSKLFTKWESIQARVGLKRLIDGDLPREKELVLLTRGFGAEFGRTIASRKQGAAFTRYLNEAINLPRTLMSTGDLSMGFRQGIFFAARHPVLFFRAMRHQVELFRSEGASMKSAEEIASRRTFPLMRRGKLALMELDSVLNLREERFLGGMLAEKIPVFGRLVRASNRAYTGGLNRLRADVFDSLIKDAERAGRNPFSNKEGKLINDIATLVNAGTGRGRLGKTFNEAAVVANAAFFSPRLFASRLMLLNPRTYIGDIKIGGKVINTSKYDPIVRKEALKSAGAFVGAGITTLSLASALGLDVETNPTSSDFGKIRIGKTRVDIWGGFQQYVRTLAQLIFGVQTSATTGEVKKLGEGYKPETRATVVGRFVEYKLSPIPSFFWDQLQGEGPMGKGPVTDLAKSVGVEEDAKLVELMQAISERATPMVWQDLYDIIQEDPGFLQILAGLSGIFGIGVQTFEKKQGKKTSVR